MKNRDKKEGGNQQALKTVLSSQQMRKSRLRPVASDRNEAEITEPPSVPAEKIT
jgi:hypothetical protein